MVTYKDVNFKANNINLLVWSVFGELIKNGYKTPSRNGETHTFYNSTLKLTNPRNRHLRLEGRKNNIISTIAETFWVLSGSNNVESLELFLKRAKDFADDGKHWYAGYGLRLYNPYNGLAHAFRMFEDDGKFTRRAVVYIGSPEDYYQAWKKQSWYSERKLAKDMACNQVLTFYITPDNKFNMNVVSRSGDVIWGIGSINIFEWTFIMELMYYSLKKRLFPELELGEYRHYVTNLHLYNFTREQAEATLNADQHINIQVTNKNFSFNGINSNYFDKYRFEEDIYDSSFIKGYFRLLWYNLIYEDSIQSKLDYLENTGWFFETNDLKELSRNLIYQYSILILLWLYRKALPIELIERFVLVKYAMYEQENFELLNAISIFDIEDHRLKINRKRTIYDEIEKWKPLKPFAIDDFKDDV